MADMLRITRAELADGAKAAHMNLRRSTLGQGVAF